MNSESSLFRSSGARLAVDIGGTFTDVVLAHAGTLTSAKVPTTPQAPEEGFLQGVQQVMDDAGADHPLVSFVTMLAPSPDWFTGAASVPLHADGAWRARVEGLLFAWGAGTDGGVSYMAKNAETQPAESTRLLATPHFLTEKGLILIGKFVLTRLQ